MNDQLEGQLGHDRLTGLAGADTIIGGPGQDTLEGGADGDTYVFFGDFGHDIVRDIPPSGQKDDKVIFTDLTRANLSRISRSGFSVRLSFGSSASVLLYDQIKPLSRIESIVFADGSVWNHDTLMAHIR